jgi:hypothetical protein
MKQLLYYFLFFVGFALILIQCAKLFPTRDKILKQSKAHTINNTTDSKHSKETLSITNTAQVSPGIYTNIFTPWFSQRFLPYHIMEYINTRPLFSNSYVSFEYRNLIHQYKGKSKHNK